MRPHEGRKLVASSIIAALKNEPVIVFGDGSNLPILFILTMWWRLA